MKLDGVPSTVMPQPIVALTFDLYLISMSQAKVHTWILVKISSNIYEYIVFTRFFGLLPAVTLTFNWPLISKTKQHIYEPKYICDQKWVKFHSLICEIWRSQGFRDTETQALTHSLTDEQTRLQNASGTVFTARRYASAVLAVIVCLSVRLSVCPSVTSRSCTKMAKPRIRLTTPYDSPETLVFRCQKSWRNSHDITPNGGAK